MGNNGVGKSFYINILLLLSSVDSASYQYFNSQSLSSIPSYQLEAINDFYLSSYNFRSYPPYHPTISQTLTLENETYFIDIRVVNHKKHRIRYLE